MLISGTASLNVVSTLAKRLADVQTSLVLTEHVTTDQRRITDWRFARRYLAGADAAHLSRRERDRRRIDRRCE